MYNHLTSEQRYYIYKEYTKGSTFRFNFKGLKLLRYEDIKDKKKGRILSPYITHITEKYGLYLQRQALPRIPVKLVENLCDDAINMDENEKYKQEIARLNDKIKMLKIQEIKELDISYKGHIKTRGRKRGK